MNCALGAERTIKAFGEGIAKLFENPKSLVIVVGGFLIAFGAAGGVTYNNFFPISQLWQQIGSLYNEKPASSRPYGISITTPARDANIHATDATMRVTDVIGVVSIRKLGKSTEQGESDARHWLGHSGAR